MHRPFEEIAAQLRPMVMREASRYRLPGADRDDAVQEALIGLWKAARDFEPLAGVPFEAFAQMCMRRQLITALKTANRSKHQALSQSVRGVVTDEGDYEEIVLRIADPSADVAAQLEARETVISMASAVDGLSFRERFAVDMIAAGCSYAEIADGLGCGLKSVDNALQRARLKLLEAAT